MVSFRHLCNTLLWSLSGTFIIHCYGLFQALKLKKFEALDVDMILMSPPCQPFTRVGKQQDVDDARTKSFLHVLDLLKQYGTCIYIKYFVCMFLSFILKCCILHPILYNISLKYYRYVKNK